MTPKILIVEDHADSANLMARLLRMSGYEVQTASCSKHAIAAAAELSFDLIICDIGLPDGNGCSLLRELHQQYGLDGIAITGYGQPWDIAEIKRAGFLNHLIKPLDFEELRTAVAGSLERTMKRAPCESAAASKQVTKTGM
jgi:DNA-binding response OmpR family regulator